MSTMPTEIKECLRANLKEKMDGWMLQFGFSRPRRTLIYTRDLAEAAQEIEIAVEVHPKDRPDAAAVVYPCLEVRIDAVNALVQEMTSGDEPELGDLGITLRQPIAFTSGNKGLGARWPIFQPDSVPGVVGEMQSFIQRWTIPFLDLYSTPAGICEAYDRGDVQTMRTLTQTLRVVAAMVLCNRMADALSVMERWFGKPGPRKRYKSVFDYLTRTG